MTAAAPIDEVTAPRGLTPERFESDCVRAARPVVLRGLVATWRVRGWSFPRITDYLPSRAIEGCGLSAGDGLTVRKVSLSASELVRRLSGEVVIAGEPPDWFFDVPTELPELAEALPAPPVTRGLFRYGIAIGRDTSTRGHYHAHEHALICQGHGKKRVVLYPPGDLARLYPYPRRLERSPHEYSRVDFSSPDPTAFPKVTGATRFEVVLNGGDALFVPVHWWHAVYGVGPILSASLLWNARFRDYRFRSSGVRALSSPLARRAWPPLRRLLTAVL